MAGAQARQILDFLRQRLVERHKEVDHLLPQVIGAESVRVAEQDRHVDLRCHREELVDLVGAEGD